MSITAEWLGRKKKKKKKKNAAAWSVSVADTENFCQVLGMSEEEEEEIWRPGLCTCQSLLSGSEEEEEEESGAQVCAAG